MEDEGYWHGRNRKLLTMGPGDNNVGKKMKKLVECRKREHRNN